MAHRSSSDEVHFLKGDVVSAPAEVGVAAFELQQHRLGKAGEHLPLRLLHLGDLHHRPADVLAELHDSTLEHVDAATGNLGVEVFWIATIDHQAGLAQAALINLQGSRHAGDPDHHIRLGKCLVKAENSSTADLGLKVQQRLLLTGHQQQFSNPGPS